MIDGGDIDIETVIAKQAITELLHRYARGIDRMDRELVLSCWHEGGTDRHGSFYSGSAKGFVDRVWPVHAAAALTRHIISNIIIEVAGSNAVAECYWSVLIRGSGDGGALADTFGQGRYVDTLERINGRWGIRHRESIRDNFFWQVPVRESQAEQLYTVSGDGAPTLGSRDRRDYSYLMFNSLK